MTQETAYLLFFYSIVQIVLFDRSDLMDAIVPAPFVQKQQPFLLWMPVNI
ncbi:hypothetical protein [Cytobacillus praedii]|nr:hypothetical protein [Cytobacillus praedii]